MDDTQNPSLPKPEENPLMRPDHELPAPHDMLLEEKNDSSSPPSDMSSQNQKKSFPLWIFPVIAFGIVLLAGIIYLLGMNNQNPKQPDSGALTNVSPSPTPDPMSNWQTYQNPTEQYAFRYPPAWYFGLSDEGVICMGSDQRFIDFYCYEETGINPPTTGFKTTAVGLDKTVTIPQTASQEAILKLPMKRGETLPLIEESFFTVNSYPAYRAIRQIDTGSILRTDVEYTFLADNKLYRLFFELDDNNPEKMIEEFDQVAKTFMFIEQSASPSPDTSEASAEAVIGACTMEAKVCPDGSTVGRVPPKCEFAACPGN